MGSTSQHSLCYIYLFALFSWLLHIPGHLVLKLFKKNSTVLFDSPYKTSVIFHLRLFGTIFFWIFFFEYVFENLNSSLVRTHELKYNLWLLQGMRAWWQRCPRRQWELHGPMLLQILPNVFFALLGNPLQFLKKIHRNSFCIFK